MEQILQKNKKTFPIWNIIKKPQMVYNTENDDEKHSLIQIDNEKKIILKTHHRITICCDIIIYRILDLISDDRVERPPYLDEIDGNF